MREILWATCYNRPMMLLIDWKTAISFEDGRQRLRKAYLSFEEWELIKEIEALGLPVPSQNDIEGHMFDKSVVFEWSHVRVFHDATLKEILQRFVKPQPRSLHRTFTTAGCRTGLSKKESGGISSGGLGKSSGSGKSSCVGSPQGADLESSTGDKSKDSSDKKASRWKKDPENERASGASERMPTVSSTYIQSDITRKQTHLLSPRAGKEFHVYTSRHNPGAYELMSEMKDARKLSALKVSSQPSEMEACEQMILYLRVDTWTARSAMALANEVRAALIHRIPLLLANEDKGEDEEERGGATFEKIIASTPSTLLGMGIYSKISIPMKGQGQGQGQGQG